VLWEPAAQLEWIYSTCVTIQGALRHQNADDDRDTEACLRVDVSGPMLHIVRRVRELSIRLQAGGEP